MRPGIIVGTSAAVKSGLEQPIAFAIVLMTSKGNVKNTITPWTIQIFWMRNVMVAWTDAKMRVKGFDSPGAGITACQSASRCATMCVINSPAEQNP